MWIHRRKSWRFVRSNRGVEDRQYPPCGVEKYPKEKERIMMRFSDEWKEMREKRINKEITWSEYIEWKLNYQIKED